MPLTCETVAPLLGAYCDNELSASELRAVEEHVQSCGFCTALIAKDRRIAGHIAAGGVISGSAGLARRISTAIDQEETGIPARSAPPRRQPLSGWAQAAAIVLASLLSAGAGWYGATRVDPSDQAAREVLQAHVRSLLQDNPIQVASSDSHTVKPWFAGRVDVAPDVKDLSAEGFPLIGGRLDTIGDKRVAVVVYKRQLHWVNVYVSRAGAVSLASGAPEGAKVEASQSGYNMICWTRAGVTYWAVSDLNLPELRQWQALM